jgi:hypothetical protein
MPMTMSSASTLLETKSNRAQSSEDAFEGFIYRTKTGRARDRSRNVDAIISALGAIAWQDWNITPLRPTRPQYVRARDFAALTTLLLHLPTFSEIRTLR